MPCISIHALLAESDYRPRVMVSPTLYFYPRSPCGERPILSAVHNTKDGISIHALLAESDPPRTCQQFVTSYFYPRSPCGERRIYGRRTCKGRLFLSTLSLRRATNYFLPGCLYDSNFYPRSPCGERQYGDLPFALAIHISIHALLAESDRHPERRTAGNRNFYPRSPCGERPTESRDSGVCCSHFYPRSPCGERLHAA